MNIDTGCISHGAQLCVLSEQALKDRYIADVCLFVCFFVGKNFEICQTVNYIFQQRQLLAKESKYVLEEFSPNSDH